MQTQHVVSSLHQAVVLIIRSNSSAGAFGLGVLSGILAMSMVLISSLEAQEDITQYMRIVSAQYPTNDSINFGETEKATMGNEAQNKKTEETVHNVLHRYKDIGEEVAREMSSNVRVLCLVLTMPEHHETKAVTVRDTWGKRCNTLLFVSSKNDSSLPALAVQANEGREYLFAKMKAALIYVYKHYMDSFDWILKADDDTFVLLENLRHVLSKYSPSDAVYLGCRLKTFAKQGFMSGGAGYVLSKSALKKLVEDAIPYSTKCRQDGGGIGEDVELGICLENVNVTAFDSRDDLGRGRFFPYNPDFHLFPDHQSSAYSWYWNSQYYPNSEGLNCCSDTAVSFHYVSPEHLRTLYYLMYSLKRQGTSLYYYKDKKILIEV